MDPLFSEKNKTCLTSHLGSSELHQMVLLKLVPLKLERKGVERGDQPFEPPSRWEPTGSVYLDSGTMPIFLLYRIALFTRVPPFLAGFILALLGGLYCTELELSVYPPPTATHLQKKKLSVHDSFHTPVTINN